MTSPVSPTTYPARVEEGCRPEPVWRMPMSSSKRHRRSKRASVLCAACQERNIHALRLVHGRGKGTQRAVVRRVLRSLPAVASFGDAPAERGGFGATVVTLRACASSHERATSS